MFIERRIYHKPSDPGRGRTLYIHSNFYTHTNPPGLGNRTLNEPMPSASHICTLNNAIDNGSAVACL